MWLLLLMMTLEFFVDNAFALRRIPRSCKMWPRSRRTRCSRKIKFNFSCRHEKGFARISFWLLPNTTSRFQADVKAKIAKLIYLGILKEIKFKRVFTVSRRSKPYLLGNINLLSCSTQLTWVGHAVDGIHCWRLIVLVGAVTTYWNSWNLWSILSGQLTLTSNSQGSPKLNNSRLRLFQVG